MENYNDKYISFLIYFIKETKKDIENTKDLKIKKRLNYDLEEALEELNKLKASF